MSTLIIDDTFVRANSAFGQPGNGWLDVQGAWWQILNNTLNPSGSDGLNPAAKPCLRPSGATEGPLNELIIGNFVNTAGFRNHRYIVRSNATGQTCYEVDVSVTNGSINVIKNVAGVFTVLSGAVPWSPGAVGTAYICTFSCFGSSPTALRVTIRTAAAPNTTVLDYTINDSDASLQAAGQMGVGPIEPTPFTRIRTYNFSDGVIPTFGSDLTQPTITLGAVTQTTVNFTGVAGTSSTGPVTNQWHRSTTPGFTPSGATALAGQTNPASLADTGLTANTEYYYLLASTDSFSPPFTNSSKQSAAYTWPAVPLIVGGVGDSIMANIPPSGTSNPLSEMGIYLAKLNRGRVVTVSNQGVAGTASYNWTNGSSQLNTAIANLNTAFAGYVGVKYVIVMLGANDARPVNHTSQAAYQANIASCCTGLINAGYTPVVCYPTWFTDGASSGGLSASDWSYLLSYYPACDGVLSSTPGARPGDKSAYIAFADNPTWLTDGLHPTQYGATQLGVFWGRALDLL